MAGKHNKSRQNPFFMWMQKQSKYENIAYVVLWGLLLTAPLLSLYIRTSNDSSQDFNWQEVFIVWRHIVVYLLFFLVHNFILAPLLIYRHKRWLYGVLTLCMIGLFAFYQCRQRPDDFRREHRMERMERMKQRMEERREGMDERERMDEHSEQRWKRHPRPERRADFRRHHGERPPIFWGERDIISIVIIILMCGMNLGVKLYFKTRDDQKKLLRLEKENLEQQLEYLKYQINPHFFMNTLNNIHALVDIDAEKAKSTILELSKMMRFILYEGDKQGVPLTREFDFIRNYITLMELRYTDKVQIRVNLPQQAPDRLIPPLMLITFIENAFKHGISYQHPSFIDIMVDIQDDRLHFTSSNSKAEKPNQEKGGVGLTNVRKRLKLLYDNNYTLHIQDNSDTYQVQLTIPLS
jgi:two-component sensor histidine kinase